MNSPRVKNVLQMFARVTLGLVLVFIGTTHLTFERTEFLAQVPPWLPLKPDLVVVLSGIVEIVLGTALVVLYKQRVLMGAIVTLFFVAVFPGNIAQWAHHRNGLSMNTDQARTMRLFFEPLLWAWALWSSGTFDALLRRVVRRGTPR